MVAPPERLLTVRDSELFSQLQGSLPSADANDLAALQRLFRGIALQQQAQRGRELLDEFEHLAGTTGDAPRSRGTAGPLMQPEARAGQQQPAAAEEEAGGGPLPTFLGGLCSCMEQAGYRLLTAQEWGAALCETFMFTLPVTAQYSSMDPGLVPPRCQESLGLQQGPPQLAGRALVWHRGAQAVRASTQAWPLKLDLLLSFWLLQPLWAALVWLLARARLVLKHFRRVPLADLEMVMPGAAVSLPPNLYISLAFTLLAGLAAAALAVWRSAWGVGLAQALATILLSRAYQVYTYVRNERTAIMKHMTQMLYERTAASQEVVLHTLASELASQRAKELLLCYCALLQAAGSLTKVEIEGRCQRLLAGQLDLRRLRLEAGPSLAQLQAWGLVAAEPAGAGGAAGGAAGGHRGSGAGGGPGGCGAEEEEGGQVKFAAAPLADALRTLRQVWASLGGAQEAGQPAPGGPASGAPEVLPGSPPLEEEQWEEAGEAAAVPAVQSLSRWLKARAAGPGAVARGGAAPAGARGATSLPAQSGAAAPGTPAAAAAPLSLGPARRPGAVTATRLAL
ncbi:hypothetical protein ABPG75_011842 [Micractinium tetrahymenae]